MQVHIDINTLHPAHPAMGRRRSVSEQPMNRTYVPTSNFPEMVCALELAVYLTCI